MKNTIEVTCNHCKHSWTPRTDIVNICPKCKREDWTDETNKNQTLPQMTCPKCNWTWTPRTANPQNCPRCKVSLERFL